MLEKIFKSLKPDFLLDYNLEDSDFARSVYLTLEEHNLLDIFLNKLHFKRKYTLSREERNCVSTLLSICYQETADIRFYNEFLFFNKNNPDLDKRMYNRFKGNIDSGGFHCCKIAHPSEVRNEVSNINKAELSVNSFTYENPNSLKVGFFGSPRNFKKFSKYLTSRSVVNNIFEIIEPLKIGYNMKELFRRKPILLKLLYKVYGVPDNYHLIYTKSSDSAVFNYLLNYNLDFAFIRVGYIIKANILKAVKYGVINDHNGVLPFVRGKSTIEYSLLYGFPIGNTLHFVDEDVDTGGIIRFYEINKDVSSFKSVGELKLFLSDTSEDRMISTFKFIQNNGISVYHNDKAKGLLHYVMHEKLIEYINCNILKYGKGREL